MIDLESASVAFGGQTVFADLNVRVSPGDKVGLVGPNGSGKSTLLRVIAGDQTLDAGACRTSKDCRIGYLRQDLQLPLQAPVLDVVLQATPGMAALLARRQSTADAVLRAGIDEDLAALEQHYPPHQGARILAGLGFSSSDLQRPVGEFSGGWRMRVSLAALLFARPDAVLLDEPTNHLDMPSVSWLGGFLKGYRSAVLLVSHDAEFLNEQVTRIVSFEPEGVRQYTGNYIQYRTQRDEEERVLQNRAANLEREKKRTEAFIERFAAKASKARQAKSKAKLLQRMQPVQTLQLRRKIHIRFPPIPRTVNDVVKLDALGHHYEGRWVFRGATLRAERGERIGIIGQNGAGKTTLLRIIAGELPAGEGSCVLGSEVQVGFFAQHHAETLHADATILEEVSRVAAQAFQSRVRHVLGAFLFSGDDVDKPIGVLSGGERARVALAKVLVRPPTLLVMDEPTNHLDLDSSEALGESLCTYEGTLIFVSHNRALIRRLATRIWHVHDGQVEAYPGTLDAYMESCQFPTEAPSERPKASAGTDDARKRRRDRALQRDREAPLRRLVATLERDIESAEQQKRQMAEQLADPAVFADAARSQALLAEYRRLEDQLRVQSAEWERAATELEDLQAAQ
jgi:ATP-binding cassette subfamily F protein 3